MKAKFLERKKMSECFSQALDHINNAKKNGSLQVISLNKTAFRNRVVSYAALFYIQHNWQREDKILCEDRSRHYGVPIGTVMKYSGQLGDVNTSKYAELLKKARAISLNTPQSAYHC